MVTFNAGGGGGGGLSDRVDVNPMDVSYLIKFTGEGIGGQRDYNSAMSNNNLAIVEDGMDGVCKNMALNTGQGRDTTCNRLLEVHEETLVNNPHVALNRYGEGESTISTALSQPQGLFEQINPFLT